MNFKIVIDGYIAALSNGGGTEVTEAEYNSIMQKIQTKPADPEGFQYKLRADTLAWELVELPPAPEYEPTEADKAEAYDILMGVSE